jgi:hypothetical protein
MDSSEHSPMCFGNGTRKALLEAPVNAAAENRLSGDLPQGQEQEQNPAPAAASRIAAACKSATIYECNV